MLPSTCCLLLLPTGPGILSMANAGEQHAAQPVAFPASLSAGQLLVPVCNQGSRACSQDSSAGLIDACVDDEHTCLLLWQHEWAMCLCVGTQQETCDGPARFAVML
jgi:hypothetical protein